MPRPPTGHSPAVCKTRHAVWGSATNDVDAAGAGGILLHFDGTSWSTISQSFTTNYLNGIWGSSATNVYVVGDFDVILHYGY